MNRYAFSSQEPKAEKKVKWKNGTKWRLYEESGMPFDQGYNGTWTLLHTSSCWIMAWKYGINGTTGWVLGQEISEKIKEEILSRYYQL